MDCYECNNPEGTDYVIVKDHECGMLEHDPVRFWYVMALKHTQSFLINTKVRTLIEITLSILGRMS